MQETRVPSLGQVDLLENGMATHPSVLAWRSSWGTWQEHGRLQSMESQRFRHDWMANTTLYVWISQLCPIFKETIRLNVCTRYYGYLSWLIFTWGNWLWTLASPRVPPVLNSENPQRLSPQPSTPSPYVLLSEFNYCLYAIVGSDLKASYNS